LKPATSVLSVMGYVLLYYLVKYYCPDA